MLYAIGKAAIPRRTPTLGSWNQRPGLTPRPRPVMRVARELGNVARASLVAHRERTFEDVGDAGLGVIECGLW